MVHKGKYKQKLIPTSKSSSSFPPFFLATLWAHRPIPCLCTMPLSIFYHAFPTENGLYSTINFFLIKPTDATISQIYSRQETLHVSGSSSAHHQEFSTVPSALVYVMHVWWQLLSTTILVVLESCHHTCMTYTSAEGTIEISWLWAEELPETCRVSWQE